MSDADVIEYAAWGELFFERAVTVERVLAGVNVMADRPIEVGPLGVGPGRLAKVHAKGRIGMATGERVGTLPLRFAVLVPVTFQLVLDLGMDKQRFDADVTVPLLLTVHGRADLAIEVEVAPPRTEDVEVRLKAQGLRASLTQVAAGVDGELRRFVARYVAKEVQKPHITAARVIDVAGAIEKAADSLGPKREQQP
ncbi:hypothetical protein [Nocardioides panacisoli]|uniref:DUF4403 family protein n=1 Tax=Nocardioides panacisoli TaxID=627624 RepID=A0ABP7IRW4_9ACTN